MENYEDISNRISSMQMAQAQLSRRRSQRNLVRPSLTPHRSNRVEKPSSKNTSPSNLIRRKTTASVHTQPHNLQQIISKQNPSQATGRGGSSIGTVERPTSWHPTSSAPFEVPQQFYQQPSTMNADSSSIGRSSYDWPEDSTTLTSPQHRLPYYDISPYHVQPAASQLPSAQSAQQYTSLAYPSVSASITYNSAQFVPPQQSCFTDLPYQSNISYNMPSWQQSEAPGLDDDCSPNATDDEELVGLGLYDNRSVTTSQGLLGLTGATSLKLAEEWIPPAERNSISSSQSSQYSPYQERLPVAPKVAASNQAQQSYPQSLPEQSFLFGGHDDLASGWLDGNQQGMIGQMGYPPGQYGYF